MDEYVSLAHDFFDDVGLHFAHSGNGTRDFADLRALEFLHELAAAFFAQAQKQDRSLFGTGQALCAANGGELVHGCSDFTALGPRETHLIHG